MSDQEPSRWDSASDSVAPRPSANSQEPTESRAAQVFHLPSSSQPLPAQVEVSFPASAGSDEISVGGDAERPSEGGGAAVGSEDAFESFRPEPEEAVSYSDDNFDREDEEPFDLPGTEKMGIVGGKGVGKSYLFRSMVYRTFAGKQSGALNYYLHNIRLFQALQRRDKAQTLNLTRFIQQYSSWQPLAQTVKTNQTWYRLRLHYRTGLLGRQRASMDVEFFDGSGEGFFQATRDADNRKLWRDGYLDARVMVFCLPLWVAFPRAGLSLDDWKFRDTVLEGFEQVVQNYLDLRSLNKRTEPVRSILALTMADDRRSALTTLYNKWISPYMDSSSTFLKQLRRGSGIACYLGNARTISEALHEEFAASRDPRVGSIPQNLDFRGGRPWLIPVSAIEGEALDEINKKYPNPDDRPTLRAPIPVHVELPLLVAMCDRDNALM